MVDFYLNVKEREQATMIMNTLKATGSLGKDVTMNVFAKSVFLAFIEQTGTRVKHDMSELERRNEEG